MIDLIQIQRENECSENGCKREAVRMGPEVTARGPMEWQVDYRCTHCFAESTRTFAQEEPPYRVTDEGTIEANAAAEVTLCPDKAATEQREREKELEQCIRKVLHSYGEYVNCKNNPKGPDFAAHDRACFRLFEQCEVYADEILSGRKS